jgi:hypothetical protein
MEVRLGSRAHTLGHHTRATVSIVLNHHSPLTLEGRGGAVQEGA